MYVSKLLDKDLIRYEFQAGSQLCISVSRLFNWSLPAGGLRANPHTDFAAAS